MWSPQRKWHPTGCCPGGRISSREFKTAPFDSNTPLATHRPRSGLQASKHRSFVAVGSGLVYAVIVALWAGVLVPMWLRRNDAENESRSVERFSSAMKVLSRRTTSHSRENQMFGIPEVTQVPQQSSFIKPTKRTVSLPAPEPILVRTEPGQPRERTDQSQVNAASLQRKRRRNTLYGLAGVVLFSTVVFGLGLVPVAIPVLALIASGSYVGVMVNTAAKQERIREARRREQNRLASRQRTNDVAHARTEGVPTQPRSARVRVDPAAAARAAGNSAEAVSDTGWETTSVPAPRYVDAPPATLVPRELDRRYGGGWSAQDMLDHLARSRAGEREDLQEIDAPLSGNDVWSRATADAPDRDAIFDRELFAEDFDASSAERLAQEDADNYRPRRRRAVNE